MFFGHCFKLLSVKPDARYTRYFTEEGAEEEERGKTRKFLISSANFCDLCGKSFGLCSFCTLCGLQLMWFRLCRVRYIPIMACLALCLVSQPADAKSYFERSQELYEAGHETEARRALRRELMIRPGNLDARYNLAVMLEHISHGKEAETAYVENMRRGAHLPTIINLSAMYTRRGKRDKSIKLLKQASRGFRSEAAPWYLLAQMAEKDGNIELARHNYQNSINADPLNGFAHIRFARFLSRHKDPSQALMHATRATGLVPGCAPCWKIMGDVLWKKGQLKQSYAAYQKSSAISPDRRIRERMVKLLYAMGEKKRASNMERGLKLKP